jgi:hypothetical protein
MANARAMHAKACTMLIAKHNGHCAETEVSCCHLLYKVCDSSIQYQLSGHLMYSSWGWNKNDRDFSFVNLAVSRRRHLVL